ncbi:MAG: cell division protein FtsL [Candidatus Eisenbacteria bacterium]|nr:cell division protein FtsL [Candidatus Eisenbacteria bacterium]
MRRGARIAVRLSSVHARGVVLWVAALATGMICVWEHIYASRLASSIEGLEDRKERLEAEIGFLRMECAGLAGRERIELHATQHLGLRYPAGDEVVRLGAEHARTVPEQTIYARRGVRGADNG